MKKRLVNLFLLLLIVTGVYIILLSVFSYFRYPVMFPRRFTLVYWEDILLNNGLFYKGLMTSIVLASMSAIVATSIGFMTGRAVVRYYSGFTRVTALLVSIPLLIPGMILFLGIHQVLIKTPFVNTLGGVVLAHVVICIPYTTNVAIAYFSGIPKEMEDVAYSLGASWKAVLTRVLFPLLKPGLIFAFTISFLISNTEYFSTFLIGGGKVVSLSMVMYPYISNADYGHSSAIGIIFIIIHVLLFIFSDYILRKQHFKTLYTRD